MDFTRRTVLRILAAGPIPGHIAFVMDGNRRYARKSNKPVQEGHDAGFRTLKNMLEICLRLGVHCVTVYAFSIENFKRPKEEVEAIMELAKLKICELCKEHELLSQYGVRLNVIGRKNMLPQELQEIIKNSEELTKNHVCAILNVCMPYTSRDEITTAVQTTVDEFKDGEDLELDEITAEKIAKNLATNLRGSPPLDMLVRTSGVNRFSDFLLWQSQGTEIYFTPTFWPDFGLSDFVPILFDYQRKVWAGKLQTRAPFTPRTD